MKLFSKKSLKGFTLIELMIVVAIIGILAAVAIPKFADLVTKSKEASTKGSLGSVRSALSIYYGDLEGVYPDNLFNGLGSSDKYMPRVGGASSLGKYVVPKHGTLFGGHEGNLYQNVNNVAGVLQNATADDARPLGYDSTNGSIYINCTHGDTRSNIWSGY